MRKESGSNRKHETGRRISTKSFFGSHSTMVVDSTKFVYPETKEPVVLDDNQVLCSDDEPGFYITKKMYLDSGLADPNRYSGKRLFLESIVG